MMTGGGSMWHQLVLLFAYPGGEDGTSDSNHRSHGLQPSSAEEPGPRFVNIPNANIIIIISSSNARRTGWKIVRERQKQQQQQFNISVEHQVAAGRSRNACEGAAP